MSVRLVLADDHPLMLDGLEALFRSAGDFEVVARCHEGAEALHALRARYLGVSQAEIGELSLKADGSEKISSICAVLPETDVINMVSRGVSAPNILRGIHESMAFRFARLLQSIDARGVVLITGGLASDEGLRQALQDQLDSEGAKQQKVDVHRHELSIHAGAIGAAPSACAPRSRGTTTSWSPSSSARASRRPGASYSRPTSRRWGETTGGTRAAAAPLSIARPGDRQPGAHPRPPRASRKARRCSAPAAVAPRDR